MIFWKNKRARSKSLLGFFVNEKKARSKILIGGILLVVSVLLFTTIFALSDEERINLEAELTQLESDLVGEGYEWLINYSGEVQNVFFENYRCDNSTGYHIVKVLTPGVHTQLFEFGGQNATAYNLATTGGTTTTIHTTKADFDTGTYSNGTYANGSTSTNTNGNLKMATYGEPSDLDASMVLWMHMNNDSAYGENDTHVYDFSGNGNNGTSNAIVNTTDCKFGNCISFNGSGDYVNTGNNIIGVNQTFSVVAWVYGRESDYTGLVGEDSSSGRDWYIANSGDELYVRIYEEDGGSVSVYGSTFPINEWVQVGIILDYESGKIYYIINGVLTDMTQSWDGSFRDGGYPLVIGRFYSNSYSFNGTIDEVAIYNRSLTEKEIYALYLAGNSTRANITESNWTSPVLDAGEIGVNWTTIEWDAVQSSRANVSRTSELVYNKDMVLWMHMNNDSTYGENDTHVYDFSGSGNNGTWMGGVDADSGSTASGKFGGGFGFDGTGDYIDVSTDVMSNNSFTFSAWIKPNNVVGSKYWFCGGHDQVGEFQGYLNGDEAGFTFNNAGWNTHITTSADLTAGNWHHITMTLNAVTDLFKIYVNGVEEISESETKIIPSNDQPVGIGGLYYSASANGFIGTIDEVAIFNRSLSAEEIRNMYYEDVVKFQTRTATTEAGISSATWSDYLRIDGAGQTLGLCVAENSLITLSNGSKKKITEIKQGDNVQSLNETSGKIISSKVNSLLDMGTKPIFELMTESGRAINTTGSHPYLVKLHSEEECDRYAGDVWNKDTDKNELEEKGYCTRWIPVINLTKDMEIAVPKLDAYNLLKNKSSSSLGEYTSTPDEFFNPLSPENIWQLSARDNAIYGASLSCGANCLALDKNCRNSFAGINVISLIKNLHASSNSCLDNLVSFNDFALCFLTSLSKNSGATNLNLFKIEFNKNTEKEVPLFIREEITTLASTTNLSDILYPLESSLSYFLASDLLTSSANPSACFSVNCDFETICLNRTILESLFFNMPLTSIDNSISGIALNSDSSSSGISTVIDILPDKNNENIYLNLSKNQELVCFVMMPELKEDDCFIRFVDFETKDETSENVDPSFSSEVMSERFVMAGVEDDFVDFIVKDFCQDRIFSAGFINSFLTRRDEIRDINHFNDLRNFAEALYPIGVSFLASSNSLRYDSFIGNSSTGCQSIFSQNSQSSSVISFVCLNLSEISCLTNLINAPPSNLEADLVFNSLGNEIFNSAINKGNGNIYLKLSGKEIEMQETYENNDIADNNIKKDIIFEHISSITYHEPQHVYDLEIENTHNFIANDIIAHNTNRFLQYRAVFTSNATETPVLEEVNITYLSSPFEGDQGGHYAQLIIWDDSDSKTVYANYTKFYANYTNATSGTSINGSGRWCEFRHNKTGSWRDVVNMSFNTSSLMYELIADGGYICNSSECHRDGMPVGNYSFNISCFDTSTGFTNLSVADAISVSEYAASLEIQNDTAKTIGEMVYFYANYTRDGGYGIAGLGDEIGRIIWNSSDLDTEDKGSTIAFFDYDNDGRKDELVVGWDKADSDGGIKSFYPNGSVLWGPLTGSDYGGVYEIGVGDIDNDGYEDDIAVTTYRFGPQIRYYNKDGTLNFSNGKTTRAVTLYDLDSDGYKEIITSIYAGTFVYYWNGTQMWNNTEISSNSENEIIAGGDVDKDGTPDVATVSTFSKSVIVYSGKNGSIIFKVDDLGTVNTIVFIDLDHDNYKNEIIIGGELGNNIYAYSWNGTWNSSYPSTQANWSAKAQDNYELAVMDLDKDGWEDDVVVGGTGYIYGFNESGDQLWNYTNSDLTGAIYSIFVGDVNGDGKIEIVAGGVNEIVWVLNRTGSLLWDYDVGLGTIGSKQGSSPSTDISDINNDGIKDIAVASADGYAHIFNSMPDCTIRFNDTAVVYNMSWNQTIKKWYFNRSFSETGDFEWNATCDKGGYVIQTAGDNVSIADTPNATINTPLNQTYATTTITFNVTATDEAGIDGCWYSLNNGADNFTMTNASTSVNDYNATNSTMEQGSHTVNFYCNDTSNNLNNTENVTFFIDSIKPDINFTEPTESDQAFINVDNTYINVSANDTNQISSFIDWNRSLVGFWNFNEGSVSGSTAYDNSTWGNDGTITGATWTSEGKFGGAMSFDASDDFILVAHGGDLDLSTNGTISMWIYPKGDIVNYQNLISNNGGTNFQVYLLDNSLNVGYYSGGGQGLVDTGIAVTVEAWNYIAVTVDASTGNALLYVNGNIESTDTFSFGASSVQTIYLGAISSEGSKVFNGTIDEVQVWNRALTPEEINASYNSKIYCYDNETKIMTDGGWKKFEDVGFEDKILTLNSSGGTTEWHAPTEIQNYAYSGEMYEIETDDGTLIVSPEHEVYGKIDYSNKLSGYDINLNKETTNNLPLNPEGLTSLSNFDNNENIVSINGQVILNTIIPECSLGGNNFLLIKCLSNVNITLESDLDSLDICLSDASNEVFLTSYPFFLNNLSTSIGKFSSERNFNSFLEESMFFFSDEFGSICQNRKNSSACELREIILNNFINTNSCSKQFHNLPDHNSCSFKSRDSSADFSINNNELINFNSHNINNSEEIFKSFDYGDKKEIENEQRNNSSISLVMMPESSEYNCALFNLESKNKTSNLNSFIITQTMPEILKMINENSIGVSDLVNFLLNSSKQTEVFFLEFNKDFFNRRYINSHTDSHHLLNFSKVIDSEGSCLAFFKSLIKDSFIGNSSIGYHPILSQNSWFLSDNSPVLTNSSNMFCFINLITAPTNNLESNFRSSSGISVFNSSIDKNNENIYLNLSNFKLTKISDIYDNLGDKQLVFLDENGKEIKVNKITKKHYNGRIYDVTVPNHIILVERDGLVVWSGNSLERNFTDLSEGIYEYYAYTTDLAGNINITETRNITIDTIKPDINFTLPTELDQAFISVDSAYVNVSTNDTNQISSFIDWNRSLVGFWNFNEGSVSGSTAYDNSTWGNDGTVIGATQTSDGKFGGAMEFDGVNDYVDVTHTPLAGIQDITISAWFNPEDRDGYEIIISNANADYRIALDSSDNILVDVADRSISLADTGFDAVTSVWQHVVLTSISGDTNLYYNGVKSDISSNAGTISSTSIWHIGAREAGLFFNGSIDEVAIWNRVLTPEEINASYNTKLHCYDNETKIMTDEGWKFFRDVSFEDKILTLNSSAGITEFHAPTEIQDYAYSGEMFRIETEEGELLVSPEHEVYAGKDWTNSFVVNTFTNDCSLRCGSFDQTGILNSNASAMKSISFLCDMQSAFDKEFLYSSTGINSTNIANSLNKSLNSFLEIPVFWDISSEFLLSSSNDNSGERNSKFWSTNIPFVNEFFQKKLNRTFESTTNFIYINPFAFNSLYLPCLDALCNLTDQSIISLSSSRCLINLCNNKDSLIPDISTCFCNSLGNSILISMNEGNSEEYLNVSDFSLQPIKKVYEEINNGKEIYFLDENNNPVKIYVNEKKEMGSNGMEPNKLSSDYENCKCNNYINLSVNDNISYVGMAEWPTQSVVIRCPSGFVAPDFAREINNSMILSTTKSLGVQVPTPDVTLNFSLQPIKKVYEEINNGKEIYFLDENNNPVKVLNIVKEKYQGRIYDVTVPNHIILVERNGLAVWSGNSLERNFTDLSEGTYEYYAYTTDLAGNINITETRTLTVDTIYPEINFTDPTELDGAFISVDSAYVNVSTNDTNQISSFIDWNRSLVGFWNFNEGSVSGSTAYDNSTWGNDGTISGATWNSSGKFGGAMSFDGDDDYVQLKASNLVINNTANWTIGLWFNADYIDSATRVHRMITLRGGVGSGVNFYSGSSNDLGFGYRDVGGGFQSVVINSNINIDTWYHVVLSYNSSDYVYYENGVNIGKTTDTIVSSFSEGLAMIGTYDSSSGYFNGTIDEVQIWDRALTAEEIKASYNTGIYKLERNFTDLSEGSYEYYAYTTDLAGSVNKTETRTLTVDTIYPDINITSPINNTNHSDAGLDVLFTRSDSGAGLESCWYSNDTMLVNKSLGSGGVCVNVTNLTWSEGAHSITIWVNDSGNNVNQSSINFTIDTLPPYFDEEILNQTYEYKSESVGYNINASDSGAGFDNYSVNDTNFEINSSGWLSNASSLGVKIYTINITINDTLNNINSTILSINISDTIFPTINITSPINNTNHSDAGLDIKYHIVELLNDTCWYSNDTYLVNRSIPCGQNITNITWSDAMHNLTIWINDSSNNLNWSSISFGIDTTPPEVTIILPTATTYTSSSISFEVSTNENSTCNYTIDSGVTNTSMTANTSSTGFTGSETLSNAAYTSQFYCWDVLNNLNDTESVAFTVSVSSDDGSSDGGGGGSSGGQGVAPAVEIKFNLIPESYERTVILNRIEFGEIEITNKETTERYFNIKVEVLEDIISFEEESVKVASGEAKSFEFTIHAPKEPGIYPGKIIVTSGSARKEILVTINVKTEKSLFDVTLLIPRTMRSMMAGRNLDAQINLLQMGIKEKMDVTLNYIIKDFSGKIYLTESETIAVYDQKSFNKEFHTEEFLTGDYVLGIELIYPDGVAVASSQFKIKEKFKIETKEAIMIALSLVLIFVFILIVVIIKRYKKIEKYIHKKKK